MRVFRISLMLLLILPGFLATGVFAQKDAPVKCAQCHKDTKILPDSHKKYSLRATGKCFVCHKADGKTKPLGESIHVAHLEKSSSAMKNCLSCHTASKDGEVTFPSYPNMKVSKDTMPDLYKYFESWMASDLLVGSHRRNGAYCLDCHKDYTDEYMAGDTKSACAGCHGDDEEMAKKTAGTKYMHNPHKSHYVDLKCSACHSGHKPFEDFCAQCHPFNYKAPSTKEEAKP
ncbi:MAG: cytochrome c3 family protein [Syntrophorhabdaceae bacterium]|nr:cytochrome c3 family protein [Syntrophorhabdaceae bacterium]